MRSLNLLLKDLPKYELFGAGRISVSKIVDDSRRVTPGSLFVAIKGFSVDAHDYIPQVIKRGSRVIVGEKAPEKKWLEHIVYVKVPDSRKALSYLASSWYENPSRKMRMIGVTGTDGKTTTASLIYWILSKVGLKVGLISTVSAKIGSKDYDTGFHVTNPEPLALQKFLSIMVKKDCKYAVVEVTSHGLDQQRVAGIRFEISVLTNITHEHLDYHKTFSNYVRVKSRLFNQSDIAILNRSDLSFSKIIKFIGKKIKVTSYTRDSLSGDLEGAVLKRFKEHYNKMNATAAIFVCRALGLSDGQIVKSIPSFPGVEGRMQDVENDRSIRIIIDFAHTPNALENALVVLRKQLKSGNRLITVFGCAGERDRGKRPLMGAIAVRFADLSVFTAEDPRHEDVNEIIDQMVRGAKKVVSDKHRYFIRPDRKEAINFAINDLARKGDVVVICGKGHEKSMNFDGIEYDWSDLKIAQSVA